MIKQNITKYSILVLFICLLLVFITSPSYSYGNYDTMLSELGANWLINNFGYTEKDVISIDLLGDNIFLVKIKSNDEDVKSGYVVLKYFEKNEQVDILEYGIGTIIPHTMNVIIDEELLTEKPISLNYNSSLESYWTYRIDNYDYYVDSATGDFLPELNDYKPKGLVVNYFNSEDVVINSYINENLIFDPYYNLNWLMASDEEDNLTADEIVNLLTANQQILYSGAKYNNLVKFAYPVIGYQQVDDKIYVALYDFNLELTRYIELNNLLEFGNFTVNNL